MKKAKTRNPAAPRVTEKVLMMYGTIGPRMLVSREMTKKTRKMRRARNRLRAMDGPLLLWLREAMVPDARCADEVGVIAERGETQVHLVERDETTSLLHDVADVIEKDAGALHHASPEDDGVRGEEVNEVGEANAEIEVLALDSASRERVAGHRMFVDTPRGEAG